LPTFPPFDVHADGNTGHRWKKWLGRFERLLVAMNITDKKQQRVMLLHFAGPAVDEIFDTLSDIGEAKDYDKANLIPKAMKLDEVKKETASDPVLCKLSEVITHATDGSILK
jgi:hypothetical protein